mgnify:CR=1 FL=1
MASKKNSKVRAPKDAPSNKKIKKKTSVLTIEKVEYVDYKDVNVLTRFVSDRSKIRNRRVSGNSVQQQRDIANAIKNAGANPTRESVRQAMLRTKNLPVVVGRGTWSIDPETRIPSFGYAVMRIQNNNFVMD